MPDSKCPATGCGGTQFEGKTATLVNSRFAITLIQCAECGTVVGAMEYASLLPWLERVLVLHFRRRPPASPGRRKWETSVDDRLSDPPGPGHGRAGALEGYAPSIFQAGADCNGAIHPQQGSCNGRVDLTEKQLALFWAQRSPLS